MQLYNGIEKPTFGYCNSCNCIHSLGEGNAREYCYELMDKLESERRIDFEDMSTDPRLSTDYLFGVARGQMFGILECIDSCGQVVILKAFSCQYNGLWNVNGWCPPLLEHNKVAPDIDKELQMLRHKIDSLSLDSVERLELKRKRKKMSQEHMKRIHSLYYLTNFRGERMPLVDIFCRGNGIPTGTGDCCAPKLLNYAAKHNLKPIGLAEFYWGKENKSGTRKHGEFYPCCESKCQPILGYMLCGLNPL